MNPTTRGAEEVTGGRHVPPLPSHSYEAVQWATTPPEQAQETMHTAWTHWTGGLDAQAVCPVEVAEANRREKPRPLTRPGHLPASLTYPPTTLEVRGRESRTPRGKKNSDKFKKAEPTPSPAHAHEMAPMDGRDFNAEVAPAPATRLP